MKEAKNGFVVTQSHKAVILIMSFHFLQFGALDFKIK